MGRTITINETSKITKRPDFVILSLTIEVTKKKYADAVEETKKKIRQLNSALEQAGLEKDSAKTSNYNVRPNYNFLQDKKGKVQSILEGYTCVHRLEIEFFYETEILQKILDVIPMCLANPQLDILFTVKEINAAHVELLRIIAENAKQKAETLCVTAGATLGKLITVEYHKSVQDYTVPRPLFIGCTGDLTLAPQAASMRQVEIQPNDINISDSATFVWEIE